MSLKDNNLCLLLPECISAGAWFTALHIRFPPLHCTLSSRPSSTFLVIAIQRGFHPISCHQRNAKFHWPFHVVQKLLHIMTKFTFQNCRSRCRFFLFYFFVTHRYSSCFFFYLQCKKKKKKNLNMNTHNCNSGEIGWTVTPKSSVLKSMNIVCSWWMEGLQALL